METQQMCGVYLELVNYSMLSAGVWHTSVRGHPPADAQQRTPALPAMVLAAEPGQWNSAYISWPGCAAGGPAAFVVTAARDRAPSTRAEIANLLRNHGPARRTGDDLATFRSPGRGLARWQVVVRDSPVSGAAPAVSVSQLGLPGDPSAALAGLAAPVPPGCTFSASARPPVMECPIGTGASAGELWRRQQGLQEVSVTTGTGSRLSVISHSCSAGPDGRSHCTLDYYVG